MPASAPSPADAYRERRTAAAAALEREEKRSRALSWARLAAAVGLVLAIAASCESRGTVPWRVAVPGALAFIALVVLHRRALAAAHAARETIDACDAGLARVERDWERLPPLRIAPDPSAERRALARDLDVTGSIALLRLLDVGLPAVGGVRVQEWLLGPPALLPIIEARQRSTEALRLRMDFLVDMARIGSRSMGHPSSVDRFLGWCRAEGPRGGRAHGLLALVLTAGVIVAAVVQLIIADSALPTRVLSILVLAQVLVAASARRALEQSLKGVDDVLTQLRGVEASMRRVVAEPAVPGAFGDVQRALGGGAVPALNRLARLVAWNELRGSPLAHVLANAFVGFDAHIFGALDRWRRAHAETFPAWVSQLADAEALASLGTLAHDNPSWTIPKVHDGNAAWVEGTDVAHPLLPATRAVPNGALIQDAGEITVISGSNMSGKTTYVRAIGLNALLAQAGGPVCAAALRQRRCRVRTSIRVEDDLGQGISLFLAEVLRLRQVVRDAEVAGEAPVLFLLDEILHGTNAADRREATRLVLSRLVRAGAAGLVTTHDPSIADGHHGGAWRQAHFEERIEPGPPPRMQFEYRLKDGPATTTNALFILRTALESSPD